MSASLCTCIWVALDNRITDPECPHPRHVDKDKEAK